MGLTLKKKNLKNLRNALKDFVFDLPSLSLVNGWSKIFEELPSFSIKNIGSYSLKKLLFSKSKKVKKHFRRGEQLLKENFIEFASIYSKRSGKLVCSKEKCAANCKKSEPLDFYGIV